MIKTNLKIELFNFSITDFFLGWKLWQIVSLCAAVVVAITVLIIVIVAICVKAKHKKQKKQLENISADSAILPDVTPIVTATNPTKSDVATAVATNVSEAVSDNISDSFNDDDKKLNSIIEQLELEESISTLSSELEKSKSEALEAEEKLVSIKNKNAEYAAEERAKTLEEKIAKRKVEIILIRNQLQNATSEQSCAEIKNRFLQIHLNLDDDEKTSVELTDLILKCMSDANHAAVLARYKRMLDQASSQGLQIDPVTHVVKRPSAPRQARPTSRAARPEYYDRQSPKPRPAAPRNARPGERPNRPNPRNNNIW